MGITGNREVEWVPNLNASYDLCIINSRDATTTVELTKSGTLADYITLKDTSLTLLPNGGVCSEYRVELPENPVLPGISTGYVTAKEVPTDVDSSPGGMRFVLIVEARHRLHIRAPYPGKYLEMSLSAPNAKENETLRFNIGIISRGSEVIGVAEGGLEIFGPEGRVASLYTDMLTQIQPGSKHELTADWDTRGTPPGKYSVNATLIYDGTAASAARSFRIGTLNLEIMNFTRTISAGVINRFNVIVQSEWNDPIEGASAHVVVYNDTASATVDTPPATVTGFSTATLLAYLDAKDFAAGNYTADITLRYNNQTKAVSGMVRAVEKEAEKKKRMGFPLSLEISTTTLLMAVIIILILIDIFWIVVRRRK
ncbi:MAG: hypothetical protein ABH879_06340 [archaeon]